MKGIVKHFSASQGYGYIYAPQLEAEVYFAAEHVEADECIPYIESDTVVHFNVIGSRKGYEARNIKVFLEE